MNYSWLNQNKNNKFILFFNGWAMNEDIVKHLKNNDQSPMSLLCK